jgi:acetyl-CoA acetyltransferase
LGTTELTRDRTQPLAPAVFSACEEALKDAGLEWRDVDGVATYPFPGFRGGGDSTEGIKAVGVSYMLDHMGNGDRVRWFNESSTGLIASALIDAVQAIVTGTCGVALVWRGMSLPSGAYSPPKSGGVSGEAQYFAPYSLSSSVQRHALAFQRYQVTYGVTKQQLATLVLNSRHNASLNPGAFFRDKELTLEEYLGARTISSPLCLFDCDIPVFGAAAVVLTSADRAAHCRHSPVLVSGFGQQSAGQARLGSELHTLDSYMRLGGRVASRLWETSGVRPSDIDVAQIYDGFSPSVLYWLEAAGFCVEGTASQFIQDGNIGLSGDLPVNTFGGSLSEGRMHGMGHVAEAVRQLRADAGPRQVQDAELCAVFDGSPFARGAALVLRSGQE